MSRPSSIDRMPPEVRDWIGRLRDQGRTIDEILAHLRQLDTQALPSRSSLGRHLQKAEAINAKVRRSRVVAEVMTRNLDDAGEARVARANIEIMHSVVMDLLTAAENDDDVTLEPRDVLALSKSLDHLGKATKDDFQVNVAREKRAEERGRQNALREAANAVNDIAREAGLSQAQLGAIRRHVLGLRSQHAAIAAPATVTEPGNG